MPASRPSRSEILQVAFVAAVFTALAAVAPRSAATSPQQSGSIGRLFDVDHADLTPQGAGRLTAAALQNPASRPCRPGTAKVTVVTSEADADRAGRLNE